MCLLDSADDADDDDADEDEDAAAEAAGCELDDELVTEQPATMAAATGRAASTASRGRRLDVATGVFLDIFALLWA
jgi:hypothetical protein